MANGCERDDIDDRVDRCCGEESEELSSADESGCSRREVRLTEPLTETLVEEGDGDLLLQLSNCEDRILQWLQALDFQVIGACRADEMLKPLLKLNTSSSVSEDRLVAHLNQYFEPAEVGMLARCFCMPLVSIRVGKINKQGCLLCPTPARGKLNLTMLPTSDLHLSFVGDDGQVERLVTWSNNYSVNIEEIPQDTSGRSFVVKISDGRAFFFWCSEKSKLLGGELLGKMKDLLDRRPSMAELTGIDESRLESVATYLRAYLVGSAMCNTRATLPTSSMTSTISTIHKMSKNTRSSAPASKSSQSQFGGSLTPRANSLYQPSLSPRITSFKEASTRSILCSKGVITREKLKKRVENPLRAPDSPGTSDLKPNGIEKSAGFGIDPVSPGFLESLEKLTIPPSPPSSVSESPFATQPVFSPYYCWCPPNASSSSQQLFSTSDFLPSHPSSDSSLPSPSPSPSPFDFPAFLPDPLLCLPKSASQQIATFTPLICDPIVHIPVIDVCSAGQGYLVSAAPTVSSTISPLHPKLVVSPLIPEIDPSVEEGARETLRLLLSGSGSNNHPLVGLLPLPSMLTDDKSANPFVAGSRVLYCGTRDVESIISSSLATIGLVPSLPTSNRCFDPPSSGDEDAADAGNPCNETGETT